MIFKRPDQNSIAFYRIGLRAYILDFGSVVPDSNPCGTHQSFDACRATFNWINLDNRHLNFKTVVKWSKKQILELLMNGCNPGPEYSANPIMVTPIWEWEFANGDTPLGDCRAFLASNGISNPTLYQGTIWSLVEFWEKIKDTIILGGCYHHRVLRILVWKLACV